MALEDKIRTHEAKVAVIGAGFVGLSVMKAAAQAGFLVTGIDIDPEKVVSINSGLSSLDGGQDSTLKKLVAAGRVSAVQDYTVLRDSDVVLICVPTPLTKSKEPDLRFLHRAIDGIVAFCQGEQLVIVQSTSFAGSTEELLLPRLQGENRVVGKDFSLAFAAERIDPGNRRYTIRNIPMVIGGVTRSCTEMTALFFSQFVERVVRLSSPRAAEMTKLLENVYRSVNIALVNELMMLCHQMDIDVWEVVEAAATKPFGFTPFYPGPGVGGECIPVDPLYLIWKAREYDFQASLASRAVDINNQMPYYTISRISEVANSAGKALKGANLLLIGLSYKRDQGDTRGSPAVKVAELLMKQGANVSYHDNYVPFVHILDRKMESIDLTAEAIQAVDMVVILTDHSYLDLSRIIQHAQLVLDTRNATGKLNESGKVVKL